MSVKQTLLATTALVTLGTASADTSIGKFTHEWDRATEKECVYTFGSDDKFNRGSKASLIKSANTVCPMTITASQLESQNSQLESQNKVYSDNYNRALAQYYNTPYNQYYNNPYNYSSYGYDTIDFGPFTFIW